MPKSIRLDGIVLQVSEALCLNLGESVEFVFESCRMILGVSVNMVFDSCRNASLCLTRAGMHHCV